MCTTCGCSEGASVVYTDPATGAQLVVPGGPPNSGHAHDHHHHAHSHDHDHDHDHTHHGHAHHDHAHGHAHPHTHDHAHGHDHTRTIALEQDILAKNQLAAERNRGWFGGREALAINLMSAPGAGKTSLLERTIRELGASPPVYVIEGDQATVNDSERIRAAGAPVLQINTGTGCHLDAEMIGRALRQLEPRRGALVLIENVGNLVCPALFDLGEHARAVIVSVTEGEDKPLKYPHMFRSAQVMLMNKIDLLPHLRFDAARCIAYARQVNPGIQVLPLSAETGEGMAAWYEWLRGQMAEQAQNGM